MTARVNAISTKIAPHSIVYSEYHSSIAVRCLVIA